MGSIRNAIWETGDRKWFSDRVGEKLRVRQSYEGEFDGGQVESYAQFCIRYAGYRDEDIVGIGAYTIVIKIDEATRLRLPYWRSELTEDDRSRIPVEAELADDGETTPLSGFLEKIKTVSKAAGVVTERYLDEILPSFTIISVEYNGDRGPETEAAGAMLSCFELTTDEESSDSHKVRPATEVDHKRHAACASYDPAMFPAVLITQPYPGLFFRMPFPHIPMKESDNYRFKISAGGKDGTLGDYLKQVRDSFLFAIRMM